MTTVCFIGLALAAMLWADSSQVLWMVLVLACLGSAVCSFGHRVALLIIALVFTVLIASASRSSSAARLNPALDHAVVLLSVVVDAVPTKLGDRIRFHARQDDPTFPQRIAVSASAIELPFIAGDCWQLVLRLRQVKSLANPGGFDRAQWLAGENIGAFADVVRPSQAAPCEAHTVSMRWRAANAIHAAIAGAELSPAPAGLLPAMITGERAGIPPDIADLLRRSGTAHLLSISGLHIGLAAAFGMLLGRNWPVNGIGARQDRAVLLGWVFAGIYAALSGFALPAQRAWIMFTLLAFASLSRRPVDIAESLVIATLFVLVADSPQVAGVSFGLSFSAVATLALAQRMTTAAAQKTDNLLHRLTFAQWLLCLSLIPLSVLWFGYWSYVGLIANLIMVPIFSLLIIPSAFAASLVALVSASMSLPLWRVVGWLITQVLTLLAAGVERFGDTVPAMTITSATATLLTLTIALCVLTRHWPGRVLALVACGCVFLWRAKAPAYGCVELTMLDVGHGSAFHWQTARQNGLYDTGPAWRGGGNAGQRVVLPYLRWLGVGRLDIGIVSHADADHSGGHHTIASSIDVMRWLDSDGDLGLPCRAGQRWRSAGIDFSVIWPPERTVSDAPGGWNENERSCVLRIQSGSTGLLLTGDIEHKAERELVALRLSSVRLLTAPHHGSRTSSTAQFIETSDPQWVWVSAAADGRWQMPHPEVAERWQRNGAGLQLTASNGALRAQLCAPDALRINGYRHARETLDLW